MSCVFCSLSSEDSTELIFRVDGVRFHNEGATLRYPHLFPVVMVAAHSLRLLALGFILSTLFARIVVCARTLEHFVVSEY